MRVWRENIKPMSHFRQVFRTDIINFVVDYDNTPEHQPLLPEWINTIDAETKTLLEYILSQSHVCYLRLRIWWDGDWMLLVHTFDGKHEHLSASAGCASDAEYGVTEEKLKVKLKVLITELT